MSGSTQFQSTVCRACHGLCLQPVAPQVARGTARVSCIDATVTCPGAWTLAQTPPPALRAGPHAAGVLVHRCGRAGGAARRVPRQLADGRLQRRPGAPPGRPPEQLLHAQPGGHAAARRAWRRRPPARLPQRATPLLILTQRRHSPRQHLSSDAGRAVRLGPRCRCHCVVAIGMAWLRDAAGGRCAQPRCALFECACLGLRRGCLLTREGAAAACVRAGVQAPCRRGRAWRRAR